MNSLISKLLVASTLLTFNAHALENVIIQYAGDIGKYSIGSGMQLNKYHSFSIHYGYTPATAIQRKIETYTLKNNLHLYRYNYQDFQYRFYTGVSLYHTPGNKYKTNELSGTPDSYYRQSSIRGQLYVGHEFSRGIYNSIYMESGMNDIWLINSYNNDSIDYRDHVILGLGYRRTF